MKKNQKGTVILIAVIGVATLFTIGVYLLNSTLIEITITKSIENATRAYYLAESGINEAIWMLNNDSEWKDNFVASGTWEENLTREEIGGGSYFVEIKNTAPGYGQIISISELPFLNKSARREIKTNVFRGTDSPTHDAGIFTGGSSENISITHSYITVNDGNIFADGNLQIAGTSVVKVFDNLDTANMEGQVIVAGNVNVKNESVIEEYTAICAKNQCDENLCDVCPPEEASSVKVDFDSSDNYSFLSRAENEKNNNACEIYCKKEDESRYLCSNDCIVSASNFTDLLWEIGTGGEIILENKITYIIGSLELRAGRTIIIKGVMVVDGNFDIGERYAWLNMGQRDEGNCHIEITESAENNTTGLLVKRKINMGSYALVKDTTIEGVLYAGEEININSVPYKINIVGAMIARKFNLNSLFQDVEITLDNEKILRALGYIIEGEMIIPNFSSVLQVDHWEEVY